ncbi:hypothetical protein ACER0C_004876 [Sarotherodon galilaeus]
MALAPKTAEGTDLQYLSRVMEKLIKDADSFFQQFNSHQSKMRGIVEKLKGISKEVQKMQKVGCRQKTAPTAEERGAATIGAGVVLGATALVTAPISLPLAAGSVVVAGTAVLAGTMFKMEKSKRRFAEEVEKLGKELMAIVEPMKKDVEGIKMACEKLEKESAEAQAKNILTDMEELQRLLRRVSKLKRMSAGVLDDLGELKQAIDGIREHMKKDEKLRNCIIQSANKTQSLVDKCAVMKTDLREVASFVRHATSFIQQFNSSESQMRQIVREFLKIAEKLREMQSKTDTVGTVGVGFLIGGILAAPFTAGLSLAALAVGGATVVTTNVIKILSEKDKAKEVKKWGEEFMAKVRPMMKNLEEIKTICEKLEKESAEAQARDTQTDVDEFQRTLRRVSHLKEMSSGLLVVTETLLDVMGGLVMLIKKVFRVTATPEEDQKLRDAILQPADQSQRVVTEFDKMRKELREFT